MSIVNIQNITVQNNPAKFGDDYCFDITFECLEPLSKDLEWKLTYVGSPDSDKYDQVLDSIMVGPIPVGVNRFQFQADPPQPEKVPASDLLGVTVILLTCAYDDKEFIRVGYYQNNEYPEGTEERRVWEEIMEKKEKITKVDASKVVRNILADKPKVKRTNIKWDNPGGDEIEYPPPQELDGEVEREMDTDHPGEGSSNPAPHAVGGLAEDVHEGEELGSEDEEDEEDEEGEDAEIDLEDEEDEEDGMDEDEDMAEAGEGGDDTMGSIEGPPAAASHSHGHTS